ncbi:MAG: hypothetical protein JXK07_08970 [Spirochaetes bacterium]|nr:hypothetical protein [Spirochaetota bacterium]MBN2770590.1 hypothetical protein [Spirochaetota bacterium]
MNIEKSIIEKIRKLYQYDKNQINRCFESDSEIIKYNDSYLLCTIDEFSKDDYFSESDPVLLGKNLASASLTDIYASGGDPLWIMHSLTVSSKWSEKYVINLNKAMSGVYKEHNVCMIGGDFSIDNDWRFTSSVVGKTVNPIMRSSANPGDIIFISRKIGGCNVNAAVQSLKLPLLNKVTSFRVKLDNKQIKIIQKYASSCTDTSDGFVHAIQSLCDAGDHGCELTDIPFVSGSNIIENLSGYSRYLLAFAEAGEYAFCFTVTKNRYDEFMKEASSEKVKFYEVGTVVEPKTKIINNEHFTLSFTDYSFSARDYVNMKDYIETLNKWFQKRCSNV